jgi:hypothetical protein
LERIAKLIVRAGLRERKDTREKINALINAQLRTENAMAKMARSQDESMARLARSQDDLAQSQVNLARSQASTDEKLNAFIGVVEKIISERRNGNS